MPPRPMDSDGNASANVLRMQVTKFSTPLLPTHFTSKTGPLVPNIEKRVTLWKFQDFSVIQILREINVGESKSFKIAVFVLFAILEL